MSPSFQIASKLKVQMEYFSCHRIVRGPLAGAGAPPPAALPGPPPLKPELVKAPMAAALAGAAIAPCLFTGLKTSLFSRFVCAGEAGWSPSCSIETSSVAAVSAA